jgi:hypothetical protein
VGGYGRVASSMSISFGKHRAVHNKIQTPVDVYDAATGVKSGKSIAAFLEATYCSLKGTITLQRKMEKSEASQSRFVTRRHNRTNESQCPDARRSCLQKGRTGCRERRGERWRRRAPAPNQVEAGFRATRLPNTIGFSACVATSNTGFRQACASRVVFRAR